MGMISFHELESVDEDDTSHGHEDPVFDVDEWNEILATYAGAPRQLNDLLVCLLWTAVRDRASNHMSSGKFGGKNGPGNLLKCRGRGDFFLICLGVTTSAGPTMVTLTTRLSQESLLSLGAEATPIEAKTPDNSKRCTDHCENITNIQTYLHHHVVPAKNSHHIPLLTVAAHP